jgi:hypothetical protein
MKNYRDEIYSKNRMKTMWLAGIMAFGLAKVLIIQTQ